MLFLIDFNIHTCVISVLYIILLFPVLSNFRSVKISSGLVMSFSLDNPGFLTVGEDMDLVMNNPSQPISGSSSSAPSSGEPSRRSCPRCHGRMCSFSVD